MTVIRSGTVKTCGVCAAEFYVRPSRSSQTLCSNQCRGVILRGTRRGANNPNYRSTYITKICPVCGQEFQTYNAAKVNCSRACRHAGQLREGIPTTKEKACKDCGTAFIGHTGQRYCEDCRTVTRSCPTCETSFQVHRSRRKVACSPECHRQWMVLQNTGPKSPLWKGGISTENQKDRVTLRYRLWRQDVFRRDRFSCVFCDGHNRLVAHHIQMWSEVADLRFERSNGITFCWDCHNQIRRHEAGFASLLSGVVAERERQAA